MKKRIFQALKTKYKNLGFSERAFNRVASYLEKTVSDDASDEDIDNAVDGVDDLLTAFQSDIDARTAKYKADAEKWQQAQKEKEDEGIPAGEDQDEGKPTSKKTNQKQSDEMPAWAKALAKQNEALKEQLSELRTGKVTDTRKLHLEAKLKDVNPKLRTRVLKSFEKMKFDSDEEFNEFVEETVADLGDFSKDDANTGLGAAGAPLVGTGTTKGDKKAVVADIESWAKANKPLPAEPATK